MKQTQLKFIAKMLKDREKLIRIAKGFMHARKFTAIVYFRFHAFTTDLTKADWGFSVFDMSIGTICNFFFKV